jgi:hypothetical protein
MKWAAGSRGKPANIQEEYDGRTSSVRQSSKQARVVLKLTGSEAEGGLPLSNFAAFVDDFRRALREFDRQRRAAPSRRGGHPTAREDLVTAFRLVSFAPGSAVVELEPIAPAGLDETQEVIPGAELLSLETLRAFVQTIQDGEAVDSAVTAPIAGARRALGPDGEIGITIAGGWRTKQQVVIDEQRVERLEQRARRYAPRRMQISGRLHMIDVEPDRVAIRAADGIDWVCGYPEELEVHVKALVGANVWARGMGQLIGASRGTLAITQIEPADEYEQNPLFTFERVAVEDLMEQQRIQAPQGRIALVPEDVTDEDVEDFLDALLEN